MKRTLLNASIAMVWVLSVHHAIAQSSTVDIGEIQSKCAPLTGSYDSESQRLQGSIKLLQSGNVNNLDTADKIAADVLRAKMFPSRVLNECVEAIRAAVPLLKAEATSRQGADDAASDARNNAPPGTAAALSKLEQTCKDRTGLPGAHIRGLVSDLSRQNTSEAIRVYNEIRTMNLSDRQRECLHQARGVIESQQAQRRKKDEERQAAYAQQRRAEEEEQQRRAQNQDPGEGCALLVLQLGEAMAFKASPRCKAVLEERARNDVPPDLVRNRGGVRG
jgi:hypothetical protein